MKNILILTSNVYPTTNANSQCAIDLMHSFNKMNNTNSILLGYSNMHLDQSINHSLNNENIFLFTFNRIKNINRMNTLLNCFFPKYDKNLVSLYYNKAIELIKKYKIDTIVSIYFPIESLVAMVLLKKKYPELKCIDYEVDSSIDVSKINNIKEKIKIHFLTKYLNKLYSHTDYIFIMNFHKECFSTTFPMINNKTRYVDLPCLHNQILCNNNHAKETIDFAYTGYLDYDNYSPEPIFRFLEINKEKSNYRVHFFTKGTCETMINEKSNLDSRIIQHGYVNNDTLNEFLINVDYFINLDYYVRPNSVSSKFFRYVSFGKPIIHFTHGDEYYINKYVKKYPLGISITAKEIEERNDDLIKFIENKHRHITYDELHDIFYQNTSEYSANKINNL